MRVTLFYPLYEYFTLSFENMTRGILRSQKKYYQIKILNLFFLHVMRVNRTFFRNKNRTFFSTLPERIGDFFEKSGKIRKNMCDFVKMSDLPVCDLPAPTVIK